MATNIGEEILINFTPMETRVAIIENGMPQEIYVERTSKRGIVGNIYKGKVVRVLPGVQAAFVEIGLAKAAFIHVDEVICKDLSIEEKYRNSIAYLLKEGQSLLVQVTKDPLGTKGARLTTHISIPSRYLVYMHNNTHVGVSQRIEDPAERERLRSTLISTLEEDDIENGGYILRTVAEGASDVELKSDIRFLKRLWASIDKEIKRVVAPAVVYEDLPLNMRALRDMAHGGIERIRIDSRETFNKAEDFTRALVPELLGHLEYYPGERPIFDLYNVEEEMQRALGR